MTPIKKAIEILEKYKLLDYNSNLCIKKSKLCALICVDEILLNEKNNHSVLDKTTDYWQEVKEEINKI